MRVFYGRQIHRSFATSATLVFGVAICSVVIAHAQDTRGLSPSPAGAEAFFIDLKDGATVPAQLRVSFGLRNMGVAPASSDLPNTGHHHLLIDTELPNLRLDQAFSEMTATTWSERWPRISGRNNQATRV